ncbi:MAG: HI0074 family nucleotidyltransferase substrate-binding subunit [Selenomonadaceae bacterium]|nr:HI0074 family nucleotidyltransferase substrate-binding subunit [Selenomonadaceae bacterium]
MEATGKALDRLSELVAFEELSQVEKDAFIQRFEFCYELMWKCGKDYLVGYHGLYEASPKKVIRKLCEIGILNDEDTEKALKMADDRNLIAHTYDEEFANKLIEKIYDYEKLMKKWYNAMKNKEK